MASTLDSQTKDEQLNIRISQVQKNKLAEAAKLRSMNLSQFVLTAALGAADKVLADQRIIQLSAADYALFLTKLEEPPRDIPQLRTLFNKKSVLQS
jgi:uncharacterized protein (DUF1778 family)